MPDVMCVQEIANQTKVYQFLSSESQFVKVAFLDSSDGQDNAVLTASDVEAEDMPDPEGFRHPAQEAYIACGGFDAVIVTVHLLPALREKEKTLLHDVVVEALKKDPDVIVAGDFNTEGAAIEQLASSMGMLVMVPAGQDGVGTTHAGHRYDHFLVSADRADEEVIGCRIVTFAGADDQLAMNTSDHLPVVARFRDAR